MRARTIAEARLIVLTILTALCRIGGVFLCLNAIAGLLRLFITYGRLAGPRGTVVPPLAVFQWDQMLFGLFGVVLIVRSAWMVRLLTPRIDLRACPNCSYALGGASVSRCPECGLEVGPASDPAPPPAHPKNPPTAP